MTKPTRLAVLYLAVVFVAGGLFGFMAHGLYSQRSARAAPRPTQKEFRDRYVSKLQNDLALTAEQTTQVITILDETNERFRELRNRMDPEFDAIRSQQRQRIMALLNPEQQAKYQQILEEWRKQREKRGSGGR
jgi:Spy/CpxP family protein refolding chaperone